MSFQGVNFLLKSVQNVGIKITRFGLSKKS